MTLRQNMRITKRAGSHERAMLFQELLDAIGSGTAMIHPALGPDIVKIPPECISNKKTLREFMDEMYPDLASHLGGDPAYFAERGIVCPTNMLVDHLN